MDEFKMNSLLCVCVGAHVLLAQVGWCGGAAAGLPPSSGPPGFICALKKRFWDRVPVVVSGVFLESCRASEVCRVKVSRFESLKVHSCKVHRFKGYWDARFTDLFGRKVHTCPRLEVHDG